MLTPKRTAPPLYVKSFQTLKIMGKIKRNSRMKCRQNNPELSRSSPALHYNTLITLTLLVVRNYLFIHCLRNCHKNRPNSSIPWWLLIRFMMRKKVFNQNIFLPINSLTNNIRLFLNAATMSLLIRSRFFVLNPWRKGR